MNPTNDELIKELWNKHYSTQEAFKIGCEKLYQKGRLDVLEQWEKDLSDYYGYHILLPEIAKIKQTIGERK